MSVASIYARQDGTIAHITDGIFAITPDANTTIVIQFSIDAYPVEYQYIAANSKAALWDGTNLQIDGAVYLSSAWIAARQAELNTAQAETTQADNAKTALQALMSGLHALSANDKGYAVYGRIFAARNGANLATIDGITNKATAQAYITGLSEWQAMTQASRNFFAKELEANAGLTMVLMLVLTG